MSTKIDTFKTRPSTVDVTRIEQEWLETFKSPDATVDQLLAAAEPLAELAKSGNADLAATLAWEGVECVRARMSPAETARIAGRLLQSVGDNAELRTSVADLYAAAHGTVEGFETLLNESGLRGSRPVRRAVRTLDVCLDLSEGDFLVARDEDAAARVESIDRSTWSVTVATPDGPESFDAVRLADQYAPAAPTDFRVLRLFDHEHLAKRIQSDPASIVIEVCRQEGDRLDSDKLGQLLVPEFVTAANWKKWWTQARSALKRFPNVVVEGRGPHTVRYLHTPIALEDALTQRFAKERDPLRQLDVVELYLRDCKARKESPNPVVLRQCFEKVVDRASKNTHTAQAALLWTIARRIGDAAAVPDAAHGLAELISEAKDLRALIAPIKDERLQELACRTIADARTTDWQQQLLSLLPHLLSGVCDSVSNQLIKAGRTPADFSPVVQLILNAPLAHFEALLWLWDGPTHTAILGNTSLSTVLTRVLRALDECRRDTKVPKEVEKQCSTRARSVLSARRYERFRQLVETLEAGMANALRNQINQLDNLGRAVREDMTNLLLDKFPAGDLRPKAPLWAREDIVFVTQAGMRKRQDEIDHHISVKIRENAKAIGAAAEKGDLSENSEYKFALEERDLLQARLLQMNTEMAMARVIAPEDVPTTEIGVGTHAVFRRSADGATYELAFVGPWDTDPSKGWINYKSPLAQQLMGKTLGDVVEFEHSAASGSYTVVELRNALVD